jgi:hypothetical protein
LTKTFILTRVRLCIALRGTDKEGRYYEKGSVILLVACGTTDTVSAASTQATTVVGSEDAQTTQIEVATKLVDNEQILTLS